MYHVVSVRRFQTLANLHSDLQHLLKRQTAFPQTVGQRLALQIFHDQIADIILLSHVVEMADIGMTQRRDGASFAVKAFLGPGILRKVGGKNLDGDSAVKSGVAGAIHLPHSSSANRHKNFMWPEFRA